jgi:hypothetical protein
MRIKKRLSIKASVDTPDDIVARQYDNIRYSIWIEPKAYLGIAAYFVANTMDISQSTMMIMRYLGLVSCLFLIATYITYYVAWKTSPQTAEMAELWKPKYLTFTYGLLIFAILAIAFIIHTDALR